MEYAIKNQGFSSILWNSEEIERSESAASLDMLGYSNSCFNQLYVFHFPVEKSIDSFLLAAEYSFLNIKENVFYVRIGLPIDETWQSVDSIEISRSSNLSSKITQLKFLSSRFELSVIYFQVFQIFKSDGIFSEIVPYIGILIYWICENV